MNKVLSVSELEEAWNGGRPAASPPSLNKEEVPESLHALIPYAEIWGIADDWKREELIEKTPSFLKENLKSVVTMYDDLLDGWLAGPDSFSESPSDAYIAFSAMRMAADFV